MNYPLVPQSPIFQIFPNIPTLVPHNPYIFHHGFYVPPTDRLRVSTDRQELMCLEKPTEQFPKDQAENICASPGYRYPPDWNSNIVLKEWYF